MIRRSFRHHPAALAVWFLVAMAVVVVVKFTIIVAIGYWVLSLFGVF